MLGLLAFGCRPVLSTHPVVARDAARAETQAPGGSLRSDGDAKGRPPAVVVASSEEPEAAASAAEFDELPVPGYGAAVLSLPLDRRGPRPVLIAAHGAGDTPRWQCRIWRDIIAARGFVLCPRGTPLAWGAPGEDEGFFYRDHHALEREVLAALAALRAAYPGIADTEAVVYAGYSQGATMGALMAFQHPELFPRLVLVEGGEREWDVPTATRFRQRGGARVLLVCGRHTCAGPASRSLAWIRKGGLHGRLEVVRGGGHTYGGLVAERLRDVFAWAVEGDGRWTIHGGGNCHVKTGVLAAPPCARGNAHGH
jgi:pimeloyl-ACP methyl ester carboxylesterase